MSRKSLNHQGLNKTLSEMKSQIVELKSLLKELCDSGVYRLRCPPYDIIILENSVD